MITSEYADVIDTFKKQQEEFSKSTIEEEGTLSPYLVILCKLREKKEGSGEFGTVYASIDPEFMKDSHSKDKLVQVVIPQVITEAEKQLGTPICLAWGVEAWAYKMPKDVAKEQLREGSWRDNPKTEVVVISIETEFSSEILMYDIIREGKTTNKEGDLIDKITLTPHESESPSNKPMMPDQEGRFANLFRKYKEPSKN